MAYQVLARKWRPGNFNDMVGQSHVLKPLTHALDNQRLHHAFLFTGTRGVGKTTLARILAKCLNCEEGVSSNPCGECNACTEITEGRFIDLIEVDAASKTKIEDTRELLENVQYAPSVGRYKIFLIDEVHMLSGHSFNALLKTLEEPPPHVKFLLATTDPQKLPVTILSRCLQFNLKNLNPQQIENYLQHILTKEGIHFDEAALWQIAASAAGSMRDGLTLLDQAISYCEGQVLSDGVAAMLGTPDQGTIYNLLGSLVNRDTKALLLAVQEAAEQAPDFGLLLNCLLATLHRIAIAQLIPEATDNSYGDESQVREFAEKISVEDLQLYYQISLKGKADLAVAPDQRALFEMLLIRMMVFSPEGVPSMPVVNSGQSPPPDKESDNDDGLSSLEKASGGQEKKKTLKTEAGIITSLPDAKCTDKAVFEELELITGNREETLNKEKQPVFQDLDEQQWIDLFPRFGATGITGNILANCVYDSFAAGKLTLILDRTQSALFNEEHRKRIEEILRGFFKSEFKLLINIGDLDKESPAAQKHRLKLQQVEKMRIEFSEDENVKQLLEKFSGEIVIDSISPLEQ